MQHTLKIDDRSYVATVTDSSTGRERVILGWNINLSRRAAGQFARAMSKVDERRYQFTRAIMAKTARKAGILF